MFGIQAYATRKAHLGMSNDEARMSNEWLNPNE